MRAVSNLSPNLNLRIASRVCCSRDVASRVLVLRHSVMPTLVGLDNVLQVLLGLDVFPRPHDSVANILAELANDVQRCHF